MNFNEKRLFQWTELIIQTQESNACFISTMKIEDYPAGIFLFKVNNENTRALWNLFKWCRSYVFIVDFEQISHVGLVLLLLTLKN